MEVLYDLAPYVLYSLQAREHRSRKIISDGLVWWSELKCYYPSQLIIFLEQHNIEYFILWILQQADDHNFFYLLKNETFVYTYDTVVIFIL